MKCVCGRKFKCLQNMCCTPSFSLRKDNNWENPRWIWGPTVRTCEDYPRAYLIAGHVWEKISTNSQYLWVSQCIPHFQTHQIVPQFWLVIYTNLNVFEYICISPQKSLFLGRLWVAKKSSLWGPLDPWPQDFIKSRSHRLRTSSATNS